MTNENRLIEDTTTNNAVENVRKNKRNFHKNNEFKNEEVTKPKRHYNKRKTKIMKEVEIENKENSQ